MSRRLNDPQQITRPRAAAVVNTAVPPARRKKKQPKRSGDRWQVFNAFVDQAMQELLPAQRAVWLVLFRDERYGIAKTAQSDVARRCGVSRESVSRAIAELEGRGLIKTLRQGGMNRGMSWYQIQTGK